MYLHEAGDETAILLTSAQENPFWNRQSDGLRVCVMPSILNSEGSPMFELHDIVMKTLFRAREQWRAPASFMFLRVTAVHGF